MDKKDLEQELENNTQGLDEAENQENESVNNVTSENDIAEENAEESSEWQFDAEAPTISDDVLEGKEFEIDAAELEIPLSLGGCPVTCIGDFAFRYNKDLTSVTISDGVTSIGRNAFQGCNGLRSLRH